MVAEDAGAAVEALHARGHTGVGSSATSRQQGLLELYRDASPRVALKDPMLSRLTDFNVCRAAMIEYVRRFDPA
jgi:hypothetical protein